MIKLSKIQEMINLGLKNQISQTKLNEFISSQKIYLSKEVYTKLNNEFTFDYEKSYSLYSSDNQIIDAAIDHTDYNKLEKTSTTIDKDKYFSDLRKMFNQNSKIVGNFHTHPANKQNREYAYGNTKSLILRNGEKLKRQNYFPSTGDIGAYISNPIHEDYIIIGSKTNENSKMKIGAFIPISDIDILPGGKKEGNSALKKVKENWIRDTKINQEEMNKYTLLLQKNLIRWISQMKGNPGASEHHFIEIPIELV